MRAIWKGHIRFSLVTIPVLIYNAVNTEETINFHLLHREDHGTIGYDKRCKKCNKVLSAGEIVKGYNYEPDRYVIVEKEDLEKINLKSTKIIEIKGFIDAMEVHPTLYETPYYAGPDGPVAVQAYSLLAAALRETGKVGVGKVVLHDREDVVMIAPFDDAVALYKLRPPKEIRDIREVLQFEAKPAGKEELKLAHNLVHSMSTSMDKLDLSDTYHDALKAIIEAKIAGKEIITVEEEERPVVDIMTALKQSIENAKSQKKPMEKALGKKKEFAAKAMKVRSKKAV